MGSTPVHLRPHLFIMTTDILCPTISHCHFLSCVWPHRKAYDYSLSYQSSRVFLWGSTWAYLPKCSVQQLPWNLPQCSISGPIWGTTYHLPEQLVGNGASPQSRIFCEVCSLLPPDPSHVTHYLPLSTSTLHLHSNALVSRRYHVSSCLKAFAHAVPTTLNILSLPFHSPSSS